MRHNPETEKNHIRSSALWGKGSGGDSRSSALWGKGGRGFATLLIALVALTAVPVAATAEKKPASPPGQGNQGQGNSGTSGAQSGHASPQAPVAGMAFVDPALRAAARAHPGRKFRVVVQGSRTQRSLESAVKAKGILRKRLGIIKGAAVTLTGGRLLALAKSPYVKSITRDSRMVGTALTSRDPNLWAETTGTDSLWNGVSNRQTPAIAIIDSGVDRTKLDFSGRVVKQVNLSSLDPLALGDQFGHGTMVAGLAAGGGSGWPNNYPGAAPESDIVSVRTANGNNESLVSDVVAAAQWVLANKDAYGIRVVNLSLLSGSPSSFVNDPLDQALEQLWFNGVVVVAASGNVGGPVRMDYAPANDPFIIVVGATETKNTTSTGDDTVAPFSGYGRTYDGFARPDIVAPGRYMVAPAPAGSVLTQTYAANLVAPGYLRLSGTSFSAPVVAGAAAQILARRPSWTPDQVKGALMQTANPVAGGTPQGAAGAGELDAYSASRAYPPINPNAALNAYVGSDPSGKESFNAEAWAKAVIANPTAWGSSAAGQAWGSAWGTAWGTYAWGSAWGSVLWGSDPSLVTATGTAWGTAWGSAWGSAWGTAWGTAWGSYAWGSAWGSAWGTASGSAWGTLFPRADTNTP